MKKRNMKKYEYRFDVVQSTGLSKTDIFECMVTAQAIKQREQEETLQCIERGYRKLAQWGLK